MNAGTFILAGLRFYWRTHLGVIAGCAIATAVLVGALLAGDSVNAGLRDLALKRLGRTVLAMPAGEAIFRSRLADELSAELHADVAPVLALSGSARMRDEVGRPPRRANEVRILGVDERFWRLGEGSDPLATAGEDDVVINQQLARRLGVRPGEQILLVVERPSLLPAEAPLSSDRPDDVSVRLSPTVRAIVDDEHLGRFSLQADQIPPCNVFVRLDWLARQTGRTGRANMLLVGRGSSTEPTVALAAAALADCWRLDDANLDVRPLKALPAVELRSDRVFLTDPVVAAARQAAPAALGVFTYFVNDIRLAKASTPFSMVAGLGPLDETATSAAALAALMDPIPSDLKDDEIVINDWMNDDLHPAGTGQADGETIELSYYVLKGMRQFETHTAALRLRQVVPMVRAAADRQLMPEFPGIADVENCTQWNVSFLSERELHDKIRPKDEQYWRDHRGTPKAFVTLSAARRMWGNRYGSLTAVRFPVTATGDRQAAEQVADAIRCRLDPAALGLFFLPVREQALAAANPATDFGRLLLGLSFVVIVSAVLLTALLAALAVQQRSAEIGALRAMGYTPWRIRLLMGAEGLVLAVKGAVLGAVGGVAFARATLYALAGVWSGAVAQAPLRFTADAASISWGLACGVIVSVGAIAMGLGRLGRRPVRELLAGAGELQAASAGSSARRRLAFVAALVCVLAAVVIAAVSPGGRDPAAAAGFFAAGGALLVGWLCLTAAALGHLAGGTGARRLTFARLVLRGAARRPGRSLATVALLAVGVFLVVAVAANRLGPAENLDRPDSPAGGFQFIGQTALGVYRDLNNPAELRAMGLPENALAGAQIVPLRLRDGAQADCLNLNRPANPQILGVQPSLLKERGAFTFAQAAEGIDLAKGWEILEIGISNQANSDQIVIPAVADATTITWALGKHVGDELVLSDDLGRPIRLRLVAALAPCILQGSVIISDANFQKHFPASEGFRQFLVAAPPANAKAVADRLVAVLAGVGLELTPTADRLADLASVENAYLTIFLVLGGLGLALGTVGLAVVVTRNVMERRGEFALLSAVGFSRRRIIAGVLGEHLLLLAGGMIGGILSAVLAVAPALRGPQNVIPLGPLAVALAGIALNGILWSALAAFAAMPANLMAALRNE